MALTEAKFGSVQGLLCNRKVSEALVGEKEFQDTLRLLPLQHCHRGGKEPRIQMRANLKFVDLRSD
jgi:hypothetical protein